MTAKDIDNINQIVSEAVYRDIETMQTGDQKYRPTLDKHNSTTEWDGIIDPTKGPNMLTPSVDEEEASVVDKLKSIINKELEIAPKKMTYAKRVLKKLLKLCDSL